MKLWVEPKFTSHFCSDATLKNVIGGPQYFDGLLWLTELDVSGVVFFRLQELNEPKRYDKTDFAVLSDMVRACNYVTIDFGERKVKNQQKVTSWHYPYIIDLNLGVRLWTDFSLLSFTLVNSWTHWLCVGSIVLPALLLQLFWYFIHGVKLPNRPLSSACLCPQGLSTLFITAQSVHKRLVDTVCVSTNPL